MRGKALPGTDRVHAFVGGRLDVDAIDRHAQAIRELSAHRGGMRGNARCLRDQRQVGMGDAVTGITHTTRSEENTSEPQSLMRISYAVFCFAKKNKTDTPLH